MSLRFGCAFNLTSFSEALQNKAAALWQTSAHRRFRRRERRRERKGEESGKGSEQEDSRWLAQIESLQKGICSKSKVKHKRAKELKREDGGKEGTEHVESA